MAEVVLDRIAKEYPGGVWAVRDLSLRLGDGEFVVLVGPSGCGKTTTLRLLAGLEEPTAGEIRIGGRVQNGVPARERNVAMVFQRPALYPHLRVRANLAFGERLRQPARWRAWLGRLGGEMPPNTESETLKGRVAAAAEVLGLTEVLDRYPRELSGGQQQRVALGRALVRRPDVFLLDEPLSNLDTPLRVGMRHGLHLLQRRLRATMVYVTHDPWEALALGDRVVVLDRGAVQDVGTPRDLYERPANRFVAGFLGWPPMNLLDGRVHRDAFGTWFATADWRLPIGERHLPAPLANGDGAVTLGIRPEAVRLGEAVSPHVDGTMKVVRVELIGGAALVSLERGACRLTARLAEGRSVREGQTVGVDMNLERCYWFDVNTGLALTIASSTG